MSAKCIVILLLAIACLAAAIATSPKSPDLRGLLDQEDRPVTRQGALLSSAAPEAKERREQTCSGGALASCHGKYR
ncbi:hypothetical protein GPEL0_01r0356 [Geoanaerobacter pelophilus]|uniref:Uncharacterized protein n=1 Tax=Geoanaerobacter pelophilus TaxID=60036 RepID=A0ABQ0MFA8_9BACT|nr:hypothetical protein [Geoanaerobacter pelophilus]GAW65457.1 hypothetical protein GPEL0_01r0356 [Geoanaerobacter pelophilus]